MLEGIGRKGWVELSHNLRYQIFCFGKKIVLGFHRSRINSSKKQNVVPSRLNDLRHHGAQSKVNCSIVQSIEIAPSFLYMAPLTKNHGATSFYIFSAP